VHVHTGIGDDGTDVSSDLAALGSVSYEDATADQSGSRDGLPGDRSPDDLYVLYTGGTTGMPKGVMWRQEDVYFALGQGIDAVTGERVTQRVHDGRTGCRHRVAASSSW
jgi:long-subunit acyl-CoA synthetase (AMP-forming)